MNKKGFTLVEIISVIALLAIMMIVVATKGFGAFDNAQKKIYEKEKASIEEAVNILMLDVKNCDDILDKDTLLSDEENGLSKINNINGLDISCQKLQEKALNEGLKIPLKYLIENEYISRTNVETINKNNSNLEYEGKLTKEADEDIVDSNIIIQCKIDCDIIIHNTEKTTTSTVVENELNESELYDIVEKASKKYIEDIVNEKEGVPKISSLSINGYKNVLTREDKRTQRYMTLDFLIENGYVDKVLKEYNITEFKHKFIHLIAEDKCKEYNCDVNRDGKINYADTSLIIPLEGLNNISEGYNYRYDVNNDNVIDLEDKLVVNNNESYEIYNKLVCKLDNCQGVEINLENYKIEVEFDDKFKLVSELEEAKHRVSLAAKYYLKDLMNQRNNVFMNGYDSFEDYYDDIVMIRPANKGYITLKDLKEHGYFIGDYDLTTEYPEDCKKCDFNNDNKINNKDLEMINNQAGKTSSSPTFQPIYDMNNNGAIDVTDLSTVIACVKNEITIALECLLNDRAVCRIHDNMFEKYKIKVELNDEFDVIKLN